MSKSLCILHLVQSNVYNIGSVIRKLLVLTYMMRSLIVVYPTTSCTTKEVFFIQVLWLQPLRLNKW